jgi:F-type H+-transporting ATPase subunit delta
MKILGGSSRASVLSVRKTLAEIVEKQSATDAAQFSTDLFTILTVLSSSVGLRRALTDNSRDGSAKSELITNLFRNNIGSDAKSLLTQAASLRWSNPSEIADAMENLAVEAVSATADKNNELETMESQLFDFTQVLISNSEFRQALNSAAGTDEGKKSLLESVVSGKYSPSTIKLLTYAVVLRRGRSIDATLAAYSHYVSNSRNRLVAHVKTAVALTDNQTSALIAALTKQLGKQVHVNIEIDPKVLGGISIRYADDVIDGTISNRLSEASRALVS